MSILLDPKMFALAKTIHLITVTITIAGFITRGIWMIKNSPLLAARLTKTIPHINDTVLLFSAIWTGAIIGEYPFVSGWLTAKVMGAVAYILLGAVALTYGTTRRMRITAFALALACFAYVVAVAATKNPLLI